MVDAAGVEVLRSPAAGRFLDPRHGAAVAQAVIERLLAGALTGVAGCEELELFGPPPEVLVVRTAPLRDAEGSLIGAMASVADVTELRGMERVRRDFVANVSHELKTPIGALGLLAETFLACNDPEVARRLARQLVKEAERLGRIVDDLLDLSRAESDNRAVRDPAWVRDLVGEAVARVDTLAAAKHIPVRVGPVDEELALVCDADQVVGALTNLLDNAISYSEAGQPVEVRADRDGDRVVVTVVDHGIGIPSRDLERIFERFYRVDRARSRDTGGTGLGLAIVRHVAQAHGGEVNVESIEGEGSTFRLVLGGTSPSGAAA